jgi:hypothetical protein
VVRLSKKMVPPLGKYGIGLLPRIPASIGNILKYWFLADPTKYWNTVYWKYGIPGSGISSRRDLFFKKLGGLGQFGVFIVKC